MDVTPLIKDNAQVIQSYSDGGFRVSGVRFNGPILVTPMSTSDWVCEGADAATLPESAFEEMINNDEIDVLLLGTGAQQQFLSPAVRAALKARGLSVDTMDTGAACRTYNVLMAEGRRIAAALLPT